MEKHTDVLGFLLGAIVVWMGFLSTRAHAAFESAVHETTSLSWRLQESLRQGDRIGPLEIAELLGVTRPQVSRLLKRARAEGIVEIRIVDSTDRHLCQLLHPGIHACLRR